MSEIWSHWKVMTDTFWCFTRYALIVLRTISGCFLPISCSDVTIICLTSFCLSLAASMRAMVSSGKNKECHQLLHGTETERNNNYSHLTQSNTTRFGAWMVYWGWRGTQGAPGWVGKVIRGKGEGLSNDWCILFSGCYLHFYSNM